MRHKVKFVPLAMAFLLVGGLGWAAAPTTHPGEPVDYSKARQILQKQRSGQAISDDERDYLRRAMEQRQRERANPTDPATTGPAFSRNQPPRGSTGMMPLTELKGTYRGLDGGLYGGGRNDPPESWQTSALAIARTVVPLDTNGKPSADGKIVLLSIGMSNTTQEFSRFKADADRDEAKSPKLIIVDGAQGGREAADWANDVNQVWANAERRMTQQGVSPKQVQAVWIKQALKGPGRIGEFPTHTEELEKDLAKIVTMAKEKYPNLKLAYLSSRTYAGWATTQLNPEPYAYESAFAVRDLIQKQIGGDPSLNCDPASGEVKAPLMLWGPYLWTDGTKPRVDGLEWTRDDVREDGTHPSASGQEKVAQMLLRFFKNNPTAKGWFVKEHEAP